jgi:Zn-dependent peptidase ImmA (M78 family)/DNA-binding XRE family transcriptional regulator
MLRWARERAGINPQTAASKLRVDPDRLALWESGDELPSIPQARRLAELYRRPLSVFFLRTPPSEFTVLNEYRRFAVADVGSESPYLRFAIRTAALRREAFIEANEIEEQPIPNVGLSKLLSNPDQVGSWIRKYLGLSIEEQLGWDDARTAFAAWRTACEAKSILVFQVPRITLSEMRGALLPATTVPVILLNSKDSHSGKIFTLLHEFAHLLLYFSGHHIQRHERERPLSAQRSEVLANAVAAATLLPRDSILSDPETDLAAEGIPHDLSPADRLARRFRVSTEVVVRRLVTLKKVTLTEYRSLREAGRFNFVQSPSKGPIKIHQEVKALSQLGVAFTRSMIEAYHRHEVSSPRLVDYLGLRLKYLPRLENRLAAIRSASEVASLVDA